MKARTSWAYIRSRSCVLLLGDSLGEKIKRDVLVKFGRGRERDGRFGSEKGDGVELFPEGRHEERELGLERLREGGGDGDELNLPVIHPGSRSA
jgi:hypothetical protein